MNFFIVDRLMRPKSTGGITNNRNKLVTIITLVSKLTNSPILARPDVHIKLDYDIITAAGY